MNNSIIETINLKKMYTHSNGNITLFDNLNIKIRKGIIINLNLFTKLTKFISKL